MANVERIIWTCKSCGFDNPQDIRTCNSCGKYIRSVWDGGFSDNKVQKRWVCPKCNAKNMIDNKTCHNCLYERKSSGGCFITSATCIALGKADDCDELNQFRNYRDKWLNKNNPELIKKYYSIAPRIVEKINSCDDSVFIYQEIWNNYLIKCLSYIKCNKFIQARDTYINMVTELYKKLNFD